MTKAHLGRVAQHKDARFHSARLWFFPAAIACLRLQELRRKSRGMRGPYTLAGIAHMSAAEAANGYAVATVAALGQFASASPETRVRMFLHVVAYVQAAKAMDGLESLMLSGIEACHLAGASTAAHQGMALWNYHVRYSNRQKARVTVFLPVSQRIGFIGGDGSRALPHFGAFGRGEGGGLPGSVFSSGMPGAAIGNQLASAISGGFESMDGSDVCQGVIKYGGAYVGLVAGEVGGIIAGTAVGASIPGGGGVEGTGLVGGVAGGFTGAIAGGNAGWNFGKEVGNAICGGSSPAPSGQADPGNQGTYIGEVDDPNFLGDAQAGTGSSASGGPSEPSSGSSDNAPYIGEVDDPNFVSGGTGSPGDSGGSPGDSGGSSPSSGSAGGSYDNPEADAPSSGRSPGTSGQPLGGIDDPGTGTEGPSYGGRGPLGGMDNPETGIGDGPLPRGFFQGGYAATTHTFVTQKGLHGSVRTITPALYQLQSLPLMAESSYGTILLRAGLLETALPPALQSALNQKGL